MQLTETNKRLGKFLCLCGHARALRHLIVNMIAFLLTEDLEVQNIYVLYIHVFFFFFKSSTLSFILGCFNLHDSMPSFTSTTTQITHLCQLLKHQIANNSHHICRVFFAAGTSVGVVLFETYCICTVAKLKLWKPTKVGSLIFLCKKI